MTDAGVDTAPPQPAAPQFNTGGEIPSFLSNYSIDYLVAHIDRVQGASMQLFDAVLNAGRDDEVMVVDLEAARTCVWFISVWDGVSEVDVATCVTIIKFINRLFTRSVDPDFMTSDEQTAFSQLLTLSDSFNAVFGDGDVAEGDVVDNYLIHETNRRIRVPCDVDGGRRELGAIAIAFTGALQMLKALLVPKDNQRSDVSYRQLRLLTSQQKGAGSGIDWSDGDM